MDKAMEIVMTMLIVCVGISIMLRFDDQIFGLMERYHMWLKRGRK